jgi:hypothetical protein
MAKSPSAKRATPEAVAINSTLAWQPLKQSRWQFYAASALLAAWVVFLVAMAAYN